MHIEQFIQYFSRIKEANKNLMCELYLHNYLLPNHIDWDPNPHVGDL